MNEEQMQSYIEQLEGHIEYLENKINTIESQIIILMETPWYKRFNIRIKLWELLYKIYR